MGSKFDKKDLIGTVAMLGLATLLVVKLVPNFMDKPVEEVKPEPKIEQVETQPEEAQIEEVADLPKMDMAAITLPEPPPMEVVEELQPDPVEEVVAQPEPAKPVPVKPVAPKPEPKQVKTIKPIQVAEEPKKVTPVKPVQPVVQEAKPAPQPKPEPVKVATLKATPDPVAPKPAPVAKSIQPMEEVKPVVEAIEEPVEPATPRQPMMTVEPELDDSDLETFRAQPVKAAENEIIEQSVAARATVTASVKNRQTVQTGRSLLKVLEHGQGPAIQIIWPDNAAGREKLYAHLTQCYGMVSAVLTQSTFYKAGHAGRWNLNPDLYSGFLRQPTGSLPEEERFQLRQIQSQHNLNGNVPPVRLFPRQSDAILLGGLQQLIGQDYLKASNIQGRYVLENGELRLEDIRVDGMGVDGNIYFTPLNRNCGGWT